MSITERITQLESRIKSLDAKQEEQWKALEEAESVSKPLRENWNKTRMEIESCIIQYSALKELAKEEASA